MRVDEPGIAEPAGAPDRGVGVGGGATLLTSIAERLNPPVSTTSFITWVPAANAPVTETVVQLCQPPVLGTAATAVLMPPITAWSRPVAYGEATWNVIV